MAKSARSTTEAVATRHKVILEAARQTGRVTVDELAGRLDVTVQTIRKDLNDLSQRSLLARIHGGAVVTSGIDNLAYDARRNLAAEEKRAIGEAVAALIPEKASIFINIGTTTEEVARALSQRTGLLVITNNLNVVDLLYRNPGIELIVVGGRVRNYDRASIGPFAVDFINSFKVDYAVIGASAIDESGDLLDFDMAEVQVSRAILRNARTTVLAADSLKVGRPAPVRIGHIGDLDIFVTDRMTNAALDAACQANGVRVVTTSEP